MEQEMERLLASAAARGLRQVFPVQINKINWFSSFLPVFDPLMNETAKHMELLFFSRFPV